MAVEMAVLINPPRNIKVASNMVSIDAVAVLSSPDSGSFSNN